MSALTRILCLVSLMALPVSSVDTAPNRPVSKVLTLLKDMLKQLEEDMENDQKIYDELACWCETNDQEKAKAISDAEAHIYNLKNNIEKWTAESHRLAEEIANLEAEVQENKDALAKAKKIREDEIAAFEKEEQSMLEAIKALKSAVEVLSKHHKQEDESLLQVHVAATLKQVMQHPILKGVLTHADRRAVASFIQSPADYFDATPTFKQSYAPQSGQVFGILEQMLETFQKELAQAQKDENDSQKAYEQLKAAKEKEIATAEKQIETKSERLMTVKEKIADAKQDLEDTMNSLSADQKYLMNLKEKCSLTDKEWEVRQTTRRAEIEAVSKAIAILSHDDAHDLTSRTLDASFLQESSSRHSERRMAASGLLSSAAKRLNKPKLAALAYRVRLDAFTKVKKAIDGMIADLTKEKQDEIKMKDFCVDELDANQLQTEKKQREKDDLSAKIEALEAEIDRLTKEIDTLKAEIGEMQLQLKRAGEDREKQSREFQLIVADQRSTQKLLRKALGVLEGFYGKAEAAEAEAALMQRQEPAGPPPPPGFDEYKNHEASTGVMGMIVQIIDDAAAMEKDAIKDEEDAMRAYEVLVKDTKASIDTKAQEIVNKSAERAKTETELAETKKDKEDVVKELDELSAYNAKLHKSCDFVLKNFDIRQTARDEEIEALKQAKAILNGADFEEFLQRA